MPGSGARALAPTLFTGAISLLFAGAALYFAFRKGTWHDEAWSMTTARCSFWETIRRSFQAEGQPPLYFLLLNALLRIHRSMVVARLFSLLCTVGGVLLFARAVRIAQPTAPRWATGLAVAFAFSSPFTMYQAIEARGYGLQVLIGAALAWLAVRAIVRGKATVAECWALTGLGVATAYIHFIATLVPAVVILSLLLFGAISWRAIARMIAGGAALVAPSIYGLSYSLKVHEARPGSWSWDDMAALLRALSATLLPQPSAHEARQAVAYLSVMAITVVAFLIRRRQGERPSRSLVVMGAASGMTVVMLALVALVLKDPFEERYLACAVPILWAALLLFMVHTLRWLGTAVLLVPFILVGGYRSNIMYSSGIMLGDWRRIAEIIAAEPDGPRTVLIFPPVEALAVRVELGDHYRVFGSPKDFDGTAAITRDDYLMPDPEAFRRDLAARTKFEPFWFAYETPVFGGAKVQHTLEPLRSFLHRHCRPIRQTSYPRPPGAPAATTHLELYQLLPDSEAPPEAGMMRTGEP